MKKTLLFLFAIITCSAFGQNKSNFTLIGKTNDMTDGTLIVVQDPITEKLIDTIKIINNSFIFKRELQDYPYQLVLWENSSGSKTIWVENNKMTFDSSVSGFKNAVVTGSKTDSIISQLRRKYRQINSYDEILIAELEFIKDNPNNISSAHNLSIMDKVFGKTKTKELFDSFSTKNKESYYGRKIVNFLNSKTFVTPKIGEKYVDFTMNNEKDESKKLSDFNEKVVLLEFWASWCSPCRAENPELVKTYDKFNKKGFEILSVSLDKNKEAWIAAIKKDNLKWNHISDQKETDSEACLIYSVTSIPDNILINRDGIIIGKKLRGNELNVILEKVLATSAIKQQSH